MKDMDLIVSRAGASSLAEITALRIPSILIPSPYVANNHQYYNALDLVDKKMGVIIEEKNLDKKTLIDVIDQVFEESTFNEIKNNLKQIKLDKTYNYR